MNKKINTKEQQNKKGQVKYCLRFFKNVMGQQNKGQDIGPE